MKTQKYKKVGEKDVLSSSELKKFQTTKEQEMEIENFLEKYHIQKKFRGYNFLKHMITYVLNDYIYSYDIKYVNELYDICSKYEKTTKYNIRRLIDYAGNEYFIRNGNPNMAVTPYQLLLRALHEIKFKEEYKRCV